MPQDETDLFQHYRILRREDGSLWELGRGAMGVTYKAIDTNLHATVALKVVNALFINNEKARERFIREARAAASLRHRNVASVYHLAHDSQSFFYAMEFIDGETLEQFVERNGPQPSQIALPFALQVARALMAAHEKQLVHRDIKPANIMLVQEAGEDAFIVKLIDFGLAKALIEEGGSLVNKNTSGFLGTPLYTSPEQCEEIPPDIRSDIYSLGVTLWYALAGRAPFVGGLGKVFAQHLHAPPPWDQLPADVPGCVRALLGRMLAKDRAERPQTPAELRNVIKTCLSGSGEAVPLVVGRPLTTPQPAPAPLAETALESTPGASVAEATLLEQSIAPVTKPSASALTPELPHSGFCLEEHLRQVGGRLPAALVIDLLGPLAQIVDEAGAAPLDLAPSGIWIVPGAGGVPPHSAPFMDSILTKSRPSRLQVTALAVEGGVATASRTILPARHAPSSLTVGLAALAYELLGGTPPSPGHWRPLSALNEAANEILQCALAAPGEKNATGRMGAIPFVRSLRDAMQLTAKPTPSLSTPQSANASPLTASLPSGASDADNRTASHRWAARLPLVAFALVVLALGVILGIVFNRSPRTFPSTSQSTPAAAPQPSLATAPQPPPATTPQLALTTRSIPDWVPIHPRANPEEVSIRSEGNRSSGSFSFTVAMFENISITEWYQRELVRSGFETEKGKATLLLNAHSEAKGINRSISLNLISAFRMTVAWEERKAPK
jgi:serine/threonine protein kinase